MTYNTITMADGEDADRRHNRQCSTKWQTILFITFIAACPSLLIPGAILTAQYKNYQDDFFRKLIRNADSKIRRICSANNTNIVV